MNYPKSSALEKELVSHLRESTSGNARAMSATVVVAVDALGADEGDALVDKLMGRRPARIVHLRSRAGVPGSDENSEAVQAWSAARCSLDRQNRGVCFEDIFIESRHEAAIDPRTWGPLVMRELPAILHWRFPVAALSGVDCDCAERVDLVVIDGDADPLLTRRGAVEYARRTLAARDTVPALADLSWERGESLRTATARLFDPPGNPEALAGASALESAGPAPWAAALHAAWLASALGWKGESSSVDGSGPWVKRDGSGAKVTIGSSEFPVCTLRFADGSSAGVRFANERDAELTFRDGTKLEMLFPAPDDGDVLARLIDAPLADPLYGKALIALTGT